MNTVLNACAPVINAAGTNCCDVKIVMIVCITIGIIVLIVAIAAYKWHKKSLCAELNLKEKELELKKEEFEREEKRKENEQKRRWAEEDRKKKENSNAIESTPPQRTNSEKAAELLEELTALVKPKEGNINKDTLDLIVNLYKKLKKDFDDEKTDK